MIQVLATNISSPLGKTTEENYQALKAGGSALASFQQWKGIKVPFAASVFTETQNEELAIDGYSRFEAMAIRSVADALSMLEAFDRSRTLFILSTTKCNVEELGDAPERDGQYLHPGETAKKIAQYFDIPTEPIVVCNACISGVTAQILAARLITAGYYDHAIVCGADCITPFTVAGFQSFKALSPFECRPFDIERLGLNIGEAASTMILGKADGVSVRWTLEGGCLNNDAYHVSAPSPVGEGTYRAIAHTLQQEEKDDLATVCVHGTATMFNDQMESKAIAQAGLSEIPLMALKGYYGHTMGAAGLLETIITMRSLDEGCILPTRGFEEIGVSGKVTISNQVIKTDKQSFLKIISGFGGCNGAMLLRKESAGNSAEENIEPQTSQLKVLHRVKISSTSLMVDDELVKTQEQGKALLTEIYKQQIGNYPKFYKMDLLCRLAFVATELLVQQEEEQIEGEERGVIFFNRTSSIDSDRKHIATLREDEIPSPSIFLYTLPNIMTGEIAIKHNYKGETSLYILEEKNEEMMSRVIKTTLQQSGLKSIVTGWIDCQDEHSFEADISIVSL